MEINWVWSVKIVENVYTSIQQEQVICSWLEYILVMGILVSFELSTNRLEPSEQ